MEINRAIIEAAIVGFERQKEQIDETITQLRAQLDGTSAKAGRKIKVPSATATTGKRKMSAAARKRIADAQKKRWAAFHAKQNAPAKKATPKKRTMSPERKAALAANLAKARAAKAKKAAA